MPSPLRSLALLIAGILVSTQPAQAQSADSPPDAAQLAALAEAHVPASWPLFYDLLSIPNDAHYPGHVARNVAFMEDAFTARGFTTQVLETGGPPLLLAERTAADPSRTVLIYLQIDGQPVDTSAWNQPSPYDPVLKASSNDGWQIIPWDHLDGNASPDPDWRIFARSASDAKGPVGMFLTALDAFADAGYEQTYDLKVIMDFEEEQGSPHLPAAVEHYRDALAADMLVIFDGPRHVSNLPTLTFGARGIATITLTVYGPRVPQHSGHYGNYIPNPAVRLAELIASMKDDQGRVTIDGFYDGITITDAVREELALVPDDEAAIQRDLGIAAPDAVGATLQEAIQYPSLNVRGMRSGWVGSEVRTIIPAEAVAEIDVRLVKESDPDRLIGLIRDHIAAQGYHLTDGPPTDAERQAHPKIASFTSNIAYEAFRTPMDAEVSQWLGRALTRAFGEAPIQKRTSGGSIPISPFVVTHGVPAVTVPTVNPDNNQHSPNENLRVGNFYEGVKTFLAILTEPF